MLQDGGTTETVTTGFQITKEDLLNVFGALETIRSIGAPVLKPTCAIVEGFLTVAVANVADPGNHAAWRLTVRWFGPEN
jgi:predicted aconitase